jgi:hypothetical protein
MFVDGTINWEVGECSRIRFMAKCISFDRNCLVW